MKKGFFHIILTISSAFLAVAVLAQPQDVRMLDRLESARKLYYNGSFYAAEKAFMELSTGVDGIDDFDKSEIEAYKVLCAIALDKVNAAGLVKVFCDKYQNAPQQAMVKWALGSRYFETGQYKECLEVFNTIKKNHLYRRQFNDFEFKKAYSNMRCGNWDDAGRGYEAVLAEPYSRYTVPSTYYRGYVYYSQKDFEKALPLFEQVQDDNRFERMSKYYAVECQFMLKEYDYVIEHGSELFSELEIDLKSSLARILSESYFEKGNKAKAKEYLDFFRNSSESLSRKDYYFSGILSYGLGSFDAALESFSHVFGSDDELSQNAYYYSANSRLKTRNKVAAMEAFKAAADYDFDPVIKEDAFFNFAKLSFDVNSDISQFAKYLEAYPHSGKEDIINNYMAASFLASKDYRSAVDALKKIKNPSREASANLQKAAFFSAMQLIGDGGYRSAIPLLETAKANGEGNRQLDNLVKYWLSECYFRNDRFEDAAELNRTLLADSSFRGSGEYSSALYNLAYDYFKANDFAAAETAFKDYLDNGSFAKRGFSRDAQIRLADSYFMQKKYEDAAQLYEEVYNNDFMTDDVYPAFQSAVAYGLLGDTGKKIALLSNVTKTKKTSGLYPQTLFELGRTYAQNKDTENASECFYTLLGMEKDSTFYSRSLMELAAINTANRRYEKAINCYKTVISDTPYAPEVQDAVAGLENVYQIINKPEEFLSYIDEIGMSEIKSSDEKELMLFNAAERIFKSGKYSSAMNALQRYITQYPSGIKASAATYYLAECLSGTGRLEAASDAYSQVMRMGRSDYSEVAALNYAKINYDLKHYEKSIEAYENLIGMSKSDETKNNAYEGRMRAYYADKKYSEAIRDASFLIGSPGVSPQQIREARFTMAKSYQVIGERSHATPIFEELAKNRTDAIGAESEYILIQNAYDSGDFNAVEDKVMAFSEDENGQMYWLAKSFIVYGDSLIDRDDLQQARSVFENIIEGYEPVGDEDDVLDQVRKRLSVLGSTKK